MNSHLDSASHDNESDYFSDDDEMKGGGNVRSLHSAESARFEGKKPPKRIYDSLFKLPAKFRFTEKRNEMVKYLTK